MKWVIRCIILFAVLGFFSESCQTPTVQKLEGYELATKWADMTNYITRYTPANTPTFSSRCFGYISLVMYESAVYADSSYQSIASQLNGLDSMPVPEQGKSYDWLLSMNAAEAEIIRSIYIQTSDDNKRKIDSLENDCKKIINRSLTDPSITERSIAFGKSVAKRIFEWSTTDGGHRGYLKNFDKALKFEERPGCWRPALYAQSFSHYPLHPHWGKNRTFLAIDSALKDPTFIKYDTTIGSAYYNQFKQVYEKEKSLTQAEKEAAVWWGDDPDETFTPAGHSYYLACLVVKNKKPSLVVAAETFAKVGIAVADAFRNCWKWKYQFFSERPNTFIPQYIDPKWNSFWPDPPFPAFPSGHAINASATATVLSNLYGEKFSFSDSAHYGRKKDELRSTEFVVRKFNSFWEVAEETANSRFYGGIHTPQDNEAGLIKGKEIAHNVINLRWKK